jgi:protein involved in ribonucleotide reduction
MIFPNDTITYTIHIPTGGAGDYIISNNFPTTILGFAFYQKNVASDSIITCGSTPFFDNFAQTIPYISANYICNDVLKIVKTGNDEAMILVNYVPYNISLNSTSTPFAQNGFSYGDILISFFLFIIMVAGVFSWILKNRFYKK